ncbi:MAG: glycoside hydrolase family 3 protein, partial [Fidelibacterota bacterium]
MISKSVISILLILFIIAILTCAMAPQYSSKLPADQWVEQTLKKMSLREKIAQMLVMNFTARYYPEDSDEWQRIEEYIKKYKVGGFHVWRGDVYAMAMMVNKMQRISKIPILFDADFERGVGLQFPGAVEFPPNMAFGAARSERYAYKMGKITAIEARALGFHQTYAPVVDINNNPENPIINVRSFGEDPVLVSKLASAFIKGAQENGIMATAKHFPGHGDTGIDSHRELPVIDVERARLDSIELSSFRTAIDAGVKTIMSAHIYVSALEDWPGKPATLSYNVLTGLLREEMGYDGLIVTDAMWMGGIVNNYTVKYSTLEAVKAGADLIIFKENPEIAIETLENAVKEGEISEARINESVKRILKAKADLGLHKNRFIAPDKIEKIVGKKSLRDFADEVARRAITLVKNEKNLVPLTLLTDTTKVYILNV